MLLLLLLSIAVVDAFTKLEITDNTLPLRSSSVNLVKRDVDSTSLRKGLYNIPTVDVIVGGQTLSLLLSTTIGDLDIFSKNFTCHKGYDEGSAPTTLDQCGDITTYHSNELDGGFFPDEHYNVTYFSGGIFLYGRTGTESVQVGDVTIDQKIALVFEGHWNFPGAGTFGLSFPSAGTYVWKGLDPSKDDAAGLLPYSTWLFTAISQKKFLPVFSHAFEPQGTSSSSYGTLAFGGLPDVQHSGEWASAPIQKFKPYDTRHAIPTQEHLKNVPYPEYFHYKINLDGWTINGAPVSNLPSSGAGADYAVDTSTVNVWVPEALYNATAAAYTPPGVWTGDDWKIDCDAKAPDLALVIGGVSFPVNKGNMIYHSDEGTCFPNLISQGSEIYNLLGMDFLSNVVTVYDIGALQMRFSQRI